MNKYTICLLLAGLAFRTAAQAPSGINFQAVVRAESGDPIANQQLAVLVSLKNTQNSAAVIYKESHTVTTNGLGQLNLVIGKGVIVDGSFNAVPWSSGSLFLDAAVTLANGSTISLGTHQLQAVPFAFHATTATSLSGADDRDTQNELIGSATLTNGTLKIIEGDIEHSVDLSSLQNDGDSNPTNEIQDLALNGTTLSLSSSEQAIDLSSLKDDADADPANEIQGLTLNGPVLNITGNNTPINLAPYYGSNTDEQTLNFSGTTLSITGGNSVELETLLNDADADPTNEIQNLTISGTTLNLTNADSPVDLGALGLGVQDLNLAGTTLSITGGNSVDLTPLGNDADADPANELQGLSISGTTLNISGVPTPIDLASLPIENQNLSFQSTTLSLSEGNSVNLQSLKDDADANPLNEIQSLTVSGSILNITGANTPVNLASFSVDDQQLSLSGTTLTISEGNSVDLASLKDDADASSTNEIQGLTLTGSTLNITGNNTPIDLAPFISGNTDGQTLSLSGTTLSITGGNSVNLSSLGDDADASATNEIQGLTLTGNTLNITGNNTPINLAPYLGTNTDAQALSLTGNTLLISGGNSVDLSSLKDDADASPTNEIQGLTVTGSTLNITGANTPVNLSAFSIDDQTLNFTGTVLSISEGNAVDLATLGNDADADPANELQGLSFSNNVLNITGNNTPIDLSALQGAANLQQAYNGGANIQLNNGSDFRVSTSTAAPLLATDNSNGRVGIGTNSPNALLDIRSGTPSATPNLFLANADNSHRMSLFAGQLGDANPFIAVSPGDPIRFAHYDGVALTERMRIASNGNVGVGTLNPLHRAHVVSPTSPVSAPELVGYEAGAVFETSEANAATLNNIGVLSILRSTGQAGYAMTGFSGGAGPNNRGVFGVAEQGTASNLGVYGLAIGPSPENMGVRGIASGATTNYGVVGLTDTGPATNNYGGNFTGQFGTAANYGVRASAVGLGTNNYGIYASATGGTNNYAGYFQGAVHVTGNTTVAGTSTFTGNASFNGNATFSSGHSFQNGILRKSGTQLIDLRHNGIYAGNNAGNANTGSAFRNIGIGQFALAAQTSGSDNLVIGDNALQFSANPTWNIALGSFALGNATGTLSANVAIGSEALQNANGTSNNIAVGLRAMEEYVSGNHNVAIGTNALDGPGGGGGNIGIGASALSSVSTGYENVAIGQNAGDGISDGAHNIALGSNADIAPGVSGAVAIGVNATATQANSIILGDVANASVKVGIGTSAPSEKLHVEGNVLVSGTVTATTLTQSDRRLKTKITDLVSPLDVLQRIHGVSYYWINNQDKFKQYGVIAQELEAILPELVKTDEAGFKAVNYTALIPFLVEAIKEQQKQIDALRAENKQLTITITAEVTKLTSQLNEILLIESRKKEIATEKK